MMATWIDAGLTANLLDGQTKSIASGRRMIAVVRSGDGFSPSRMSALTMARP